MSDEKHDQNKGLETPDTAPSIMRVIAYGLLGYLLVACIGGFFFYGIDISRDSSFEDSNAQVIVGQSTGSYPPAAYLTNSASLNLIPQQIQLGNLHVASDATELATVLDTFPEAQIIFIDDPVLNDETKVSLLNQQFEDGKMIVGLRTSHARLSQALGLTPQMSDLSQAERIDSVIWISGWYRDEDGELREIVDTWDQFPTMMTTVHILADSSQ
ncbi:MAG: hypothetical protein AAF485_21995 [Chloroflexota bacterium]